MLYNWFLSQLFESFLVKTNSEEERFTSEIFPGFLIASHDFYKQSFQSAYS